MVFHMDINPQRLSAMRIAIELGVDEADFTFRNVSERSAWSDLVDEFDSFADRDDLVWVAA